MTDKTVQQHLEASETLAKTISNANALVVKLQKQLAEARQVLELLGEWSHPKMSISPLYGDWVPNGTDRMTGAQIVGVEVKRISALLGDRA